MKIAIVNGPNLNLVGTRETSIYGVERLHEYFDQLKAEYTDCHLEFFQSNDEGALVSLIQTVEVDVIILNAGAFTHTSIALADAVAAIETPVIEVHISNVYKREFFRQHSYISAKAAGTVTGFGLAGYKIAIEAAKAL